jgi:phytoene dehydrogenase-like protein
MFASGDACLPEGGMGTIGRTLAKEIPSENLRLNTGVTNIQRTEGNLTRVFTSPTTAVVADAVVLAVDPQSCTALTRTLSDAEKVIVPEGRACACLYFGFDGPPPLSRPMLVLNGEPVSDERPINNLCFPNTVYCGKIDAGNFAAHSHYKRPVVPYTVHLQVCSSYAPPGKSLASVTVVGNIGSYWSEAEAVIKVRAHLCEWFGNGECHSS